MAKFFTTSDDIAELARTKWEETGMAHMGLILKVLSTSSMGELMKVSKASAMTEWALNEEDVVCLLINEEAFDRLTDDIKEKLMEGILSNVSFDSEKGKLNVDNSKFGEVIRMSKKYSNYVELLETSYLVIEQIKEEEKERKASKKSKKEQ